MSDRATWLEEWCPECRAAPGACCRQGRYSTRTRPVAAPWLHCARGWRARSCQARGVQPGEVCFTPSGREAFRPHTARLRAGRHALVAHDAVWGELERHGVTLATVPFSGRASVGGSVGTIALSGAHDNEPVDVERWSGGRDELAYALEAPVWDRYGTFAGQPRVRGTVVWWLSDRSVLIGGERGGERFEEAIA